MDRSSHQRSARISPPPSAAARRTLNLGAKHENLDQKAYQLLKSMIIERKLLPGEKISQEQLAVEMGISRTPLVNALKLLEQDKLVRSLPRRGFFVRHFSKSEMISIFELREVLEGLAARGAAQNITDREIAQLKGFFDQFSDSQGGIDIRAYAREDRNFHMFLLAVSAKEFLNSILETYNIISYSYQSISSEGLVQSPGQTIHDHRAIIDAVSRRDAEAAENLMRRHLRKSVDLLKQTFDTARG